MEDLVRLARRERYRLRRALRVFTLATMQRRCGLPLVMRVSNFYVPDPGEVPDLRRLRDADQPRVQRLERAATVEVEDDERGALVRVGGMVWCERFTCPVCGPMMWAPVVRDLQNGAVAWQARGGEIVDVVLRLAPLKSRDLVQALHALLDGWDAVRGTHDAAQRRRMQFLGLAGFHSQLMIGLDEHGRWDPCLRALLFVHGQQLRDPRVLRRLENVIWRGWVLGNHDVDLRPPTRQRGLQISLVDPGSQAVAAAVTAYVAGTGALPDGTRSMHEILAAACNRDRAMGDRWHEIERAVRRRVMRRWSTGMQALLDLPASDQVTAPQRSTVAYWGKDWEHIEPHMPVPLEVVEDALAADRDPCQDLARWTHANGLPTPKQPAGPAKSQRPQKRKNKRRR